MKPIGRIHGRLRFLYLLPGLAAALASCVPGGLTTVVDGPTGLAVSIKPPRSVVPFGETLLFTAHDGVPPYVFSLTQGAGTLNAATGSYVAPSARGTAVIRVTDAANGAADALVSIVDPGVVVLGIDPATITLSINTQATFSAFGGVPPYAFSVASGGGSIDPVTGLYTAPLAAGSAVVRVTDAAASTMDATVTIHSAGVILGIRPTALVVSVSGSATFYPVGGTAPYTFALSSNGSGVGAVINPTSGLYVAGPIGGTTAAPVTDVVTVTDGAGSAVRATVTVVQLATTVDYWIPSVSLPAAGNAGAAMAAGSFTLENRGIGPGSQTVSWGAYLSTDTTLSAGDVLVVSGTRSALAATASAAVGITGTFPDIAAASWNWIVAVDAADDVEKTNNAATAILVLSPRSVDYAVTAVASTGGTTAGYPLTGSFTLTNNGTQAGTQTVYWTAYLSTDATLDGADTVIDTGSRTALTAGASATGVNFGGTWPAASGNRYLIVRARAGDAIAPGYDTASSAMVVTTPPDVNYAVTAVAGTGGVTAGYPLTGSFALTNGGARDGINTVYWTAYVSDSPTLGVGTDTEIGTGNQAALAAGASTTGVTFGGTWPVTPGNHYLIVSASAEDDLIPGNNTAASAMVVTAAPDVDYTVTVAAPTGGTTAGLSWAGTFTVTNNGTFAGSRSVYWIVYLSSDATFQIGTDSVLDSGSSAALTAGATSAPILFGGTWTSNAGSTWYLFVSVSAGDDVNALNDTGNNGPITVNP